MFKKVREQGVSLRASHIFMTIISVALSIVLIAETRRTSAAFNELSGATDKYIELAESASELIVASDYLTQEVQSFSITAERTHMDSYFEEADINRRRENSVDTLMQGVGNSEPYRLLGNAMKESLKLMDTEYYAMALVVSARGITDVPVTIKNIRLSDEDKALSAADKMEKARYMVHDEKYHTSKDIIRDNMTRCIQELKKMTHGIQNDATAKMKEELFRIRIHIIVMAVGIVLFLIITRVLGITPLLKGVEKIKQDKELPVVGAYEYRYLARTYNDIYSAFKQNIANLNYHVSHDKLTGLYNRMGYDILRSNLDFKTTTVIMIDMDRFKGINDRYGHDVGDRVLQKLAATLKNAFRSDDYICRLGGDEFVVFMMYTASNYRKVITEKIERINASLGDGKDALPPVSISAGVVYGKDEPDREKIMKHVDEALYAMKAKGRRGCYFYGGEELAG